ncbi:COMPASS (complex proteins associated with Set1p) component [Thecaphora frezii]
MSPPSPCSQAAPHAEDVYCICKSSYNEDDSMIQCDRCEQWYHYSCVNITEQQSQLIDLFICPVCEQATSDRTTWTPKCRRDACPRPARAPLSRYCSDRCGTLAVSARLAKARIPSSSATLARWSELPVVRSAQKRQGLVVWAQKPDANPATAAAVVPATGRTAARDQEAPVWTEATKQRARTWFERFEEKRLLNMTRGLGIVDRQHVVAQCRRKRRESGSRGGAMAATTAAEFAPWIDEPGAQNAVLSSSAMQVERHHHLLLTLQTRLKSRLDVLDARQKLVALAAHASTVENKCGYHPLLGLDDDELALWLDQEGRRDKVLDENPDVLDPQAACVAAKRKCKRHNEWAWIKEAEVEGERDAALAQLAGVEDRIAVGMGVEEGGSR